MPTVLRSRRVVVDGQVRAADIVLADAHIVAVVDYGHGADHDITDFGDWVISPGIVDSHVHINEPGRTEWEGFRSATQAAVVGGITTVVDMPLNCIPATTTRAAAQTKLEALDRQLYVDAAFWGGVIPGNSGDLAGLREFGCKGAKCFTCPSGVDEFPHVVQRDLELAAPILRDLGMTLLVHAEAPRPLELAEKAVASADPRLYATYLRSRPEQAENDAIAMVIDVARRHHLAVHIVHLSSASALPMIAAAQRQGLAVTAETCLHYLTFCAEDIPDGATCYKCAPPIRERANREALWQGLRDGVLTMVVSDHSPCTPQLKRSETGDFMGAWGGIAGLQLGLSALWTAASARGFGLVDVARWNSENTAKLAGLDHAKGTIAPQMDADFVIWDPGADIHVIGSELYHRHKLTPYDGLRLRGKVHQTWLRGTPAWTREAGFLGPSGRFVPSRTACSAR
ncbi:MAG: allantoinase AllB [Myxococcales bacterium]|nr:allantoinase AllB [Myxococcales bacterium]